jgi:hypothetical protein
VIAKSRLASNRTGVKQSLIQEQTEVRAKEQTVQASTLNYNTEKYVYVDAHLVKPAELECSLCYRLLYNPVTTPCGHSFWMTCLERSLDHNDKCPLCKFTLAEYLAERRRFVTTFLDTLIQSFYGAEFAERRRQVLAGNQRGAELIRELGHPTRLGARLVGEMLALHDHLCALHPEGAVPAGEIV